MKNQQNQVMSSSSREKILSRIKKSLEEGRDYTFPLSGLDEEEFPIPEDLLAIFADELKAIGGNVKIFSEQEAIIDSVVQLITDKELKNVFCIDTKLRELLKSRVSFTDDFDKFNEVEASVTKCEFLISRTGSVVISSHHESGRRLNVFPPIHIVIASQSQLVALPTNALEKLDERYGADFPSLISFITGASRTADIEKTLVMGAHGPKEIYVFIDKNS